MLFLSGAALAYFVVVPLALPWLFGFAGPSLVPLITAEDYFSFVFAMVLTFGVSFELPIVVLALSALGIVTPQFLSKYRRHAIVLIVIIGAFLTPGDMVWTTLALSVPLYALYELSVARVVRHLSPEAGAPAIARRRQRARALRGARVRRLIGGAILCCAAAGAPIGADHSRPADCSCGSAPARAARFPAMIRAPW